MKARNQYTKAQAEGREPPKARNQFMKAEETGSRKPKGANQFTTGKREGHDPITRDKLRAERALQLLELEASGKITLSNGRRKSCEILLEYGKAKVAAAQQEPAKPERSDEEINQGIASTLPTLLTSKLDLSRIALRAIIAAHPCLLQEISIRPADALPAKVG
jgi:hypothetical protein